MIDENIRFGVESGDVKGAAEALAAALTSANDALAATAKTVKDINKPLGVYTRHMMKLAEVAPATAASAKGLQTQVAATATVVGYAAEQTLKLKAAEELEVTTKAKAVAASRSVASALKEEAIARIAALNAATKQQLKAVPAGKGATGTEQQAFVKAAEALRNYVSQHQIAGVKIKEVGAGVAKNVQAVYGPVLAGLRDKFQALRDAQAGLGATFEKNMRKAAASAQMLARSITAKAVADRKAADAKAVQAAETIKLEAALKAETRAREAALNVARQQIAASATKQVVPSGKSKGAVFQSTDAEQLALAKSKDALTSYANKHKVTAAQIKKVTTDVARHMVETYGGALNGLRDKMAGVQTATSALGSTSKAAFDKTAKATDKVAITMDELRHSSKLVARIILYDITRRAMHAFVGSLREGITEAIELRKRIAEIRTISQDTPRAVNEWVDRLRAVSDEYGSTNLDVVEGAYQALSNQVAKGAEIFSYMEEVVKLGATTMATTAETVAYTSSVINAFNLSIGDMYEISAKAFKTIEYGRIRMTEMADIMGRSFAFANSLGIAFEEVNAALAAMTRQGVKTAVAQTFLVNVLQKLIKPTDALEKAFKALGYETVEAALATGGFLSLLSELEEHAGGAASELAELYGRIRATTGALMLSGTGAQIATEVLYKQLFESFDSYDKAIKTVLENAGKTIEIEMNKIKNFFTIDLGSAAVTGIATISNGLISLNMLLKTVAISLSTAAAGWLAYKAAVVAATFATTGLAAAIALNPVGLLLGALAASAVLAIGVLAATSNSASDHYAKMAKMDEEYNKARKRATLEATSQLTWSIMQRTKAESRHLTEQAKAHQETVSILTGWYDSLASNMKNVFKTAFDVVAASLKDIKKEIRTGETASKSLGKAMDKYRKSAAESDFDKTMANLGDSSAGLKKLAEAMAAYQKAARESTTAHETEGMKENYNTAIKYANQKYDIEKKIIDNLRKRSLKGSTPQKTEQNIAANNKAIQKAMEQAAKTRQKIRDLEKERIGTLRILKREQDAETARLKEQAEHVKSIKDQLASLKQQRDVITGKPAGERTDQDKQDLADITQALRDGFAEWGRVTDQEDSMVPVLEQLSNSFGVLTEIRDTQDKLYKVQEERKKLAQRKEDTTETLKSLKEIINTSGESQKESLIQMSKLLDEQGARRLRTPEGRVITKADMVDALRTLPAMLYGRDEAAQAVEIGRIISQLQSFFPEGGAAEAAVGPEIKKYLEQATLGQTAKEQIHVLNEALGKAGVPTIDSNVKNMEKNIADLARRWQPYPEGATDTEKAAIDQLTVQKQAKQVTAAIAQLQQSQAASIAKVKQQQAADAAAKQRVQVSGQFQQVAAQQQMGIPMLTSAIKANTAVQLRQAGLITPQAPSKQPQVHGPVHITVNEAKTPEATYNKIATRWRRDTARGVLAR